MGAAARTARLPRRVAWPRRLIAVLALAAALAAGYVFWLRDSSLVAVEQVRVEGLTAVSDPEVATALEHAGREMTTLHVDVDKLAAAVRGHPTVESISASASLPHALTITVEERVPVAVTEATGVPVAADGVLLPSVEVEEGSLPSIDATAGENAAALDEAGRDQAIVLGAAPEPLAKVVEGADRTPDGVEVELSGGIALLFGEPSEAGAKWDAAARVLADPGISALDYIDLRAPERPAVGGAVPTGGVAEPPAAE